MLNDDLISRKALLNELGISPDEWAKGRTIIAIINDLYVVDAEPVRHSEWVEEKDRVRHWHCRECGLIEGMAHYMMHYCPNCGAKMEKST